MLAEEISIQPLGHLVKCRRRPPRVVVTLDYYELLKAGVLRIAGRQSDKAEIKVLVQVFAVRWSDKEVL